MGSACLESSLGDEVLLPSHTLWFSLKLLPFHFRGFNDSHSTFIHITPKSLEPRLCSQITDLQDPMSATYLHQDTERIQNIRTVITIFPNRSSLGAPSFLLATAFLVQKFKHSSSFLLLPAQDHTESTSDVSWIYSLPSIPLPPTYSPCYSLSGRLLQLPSGFPLLFFFLSKESSV